MLSQPSQTMENSPQNHPNNNHNDPLNDHDYCSPNKALAQKQPTDNNASTSLTPPDAQMIGPRGDTFSLPKQQTSNDDESDSSSSSSLSSSAGSRKDLVIAQEPSSLPIKSADVPPPKRKPGRPRLNPDATKNSPQLAASAATKARPSRPRQSTSVTDKSEWIMGEEQIDSVLSEQLIEEPREKRHKPKEIDSAYEQFSSSDYSSSDAESDQDSEDDPDRLWCVCQKPHEGKFMICCDICKDWFHGHCVGVTKLMGDRFEKQGKEWFCGECQEKLRSGIPRTAIPKKIVKKEKKSKIPGKRGRGRPRKSESLAKDQPTRASSRTTRKSSSSLDPKFGVDNLRLRKNLARTETRSESFDSSFEDSQRLKELIKERKKSFFLKRKLAEQQRAAKRTEMGFGRQSLTASLSDSLDSLATSTNTPNMNNLPINIKSEHKERQKPNIVLQINTKKDSGADNDSRIVTTIVRSSKKSRHSESNDLVVNDIFTAEPIQINKKVKIHTEPTSPQVTPKKKRKVSESSPTNGASPLVNSKYIAQKIKESLESRYDQMKDLDVPREKIEILAVDIEAQLNSCFKETPKYMAKFRSLLFNLRDQKNQGLVRNVLSGEVTPAKLVRMSPEEMASHELAKWRERENKHSIELIKRDAELTAQQVIVKKTHKGEEVISAPTVNKPDDPTATVDSQEPPTTPTKQSAKEIRTPPPTATTVSSGPIKMKITGVGSDSTRKIQPTEPLEAPSSTPNVELQAEEDPSTSIDNPSASIDKPKRIRVSIETKLDPANLSRLREPLIRPSEAPVEESNDSPNAEASPNAVTNTHEEPEEDDDDAYDPSDYIIQQKSTNLEHTTLCWTGTINMPDIAKFSASAKPVSGDVDFMREEIEQNLLVCGRIAPDQVQGYIKKLRDLKSTNRNQILVIQLLPLNTEDKANFENFFDYLYSRNRYGVIQASALKDFYILPIQQKGSIPEIIKPIKGPGIQNRDQNSLLGLLVRSKKSPSSYTPAPIK